jgi:hypothetical protein
MLHLLLVRILTRLGHAVGSPGWIGLGLTTLTVQPG